MAFSNQKKVEWVVKPDKIAMEVKREEIAASVRVRVLFFMFCFHF